MNIKVTIGAAGLLLVGMIVLVFIGEAPPEDTGPVGLWPDFAAADVSSLAWDSGTGPVSVRRVGPAEWDVDKGGVWVPADPTVVEEILSELGRTEVLRREPGETVSAGLREEWGLNRPQGTVSFVLRGAPVKLSFGKTALGRDAVYASRAGSDDVFVISDDVQETLLETVADGVRRRRLFSWSVPDVDRIEVERGDEVAFAAARMKGNEFIWWAEAPFEDYLTEKLEGGLLATVLRLEATDFVSDDADAAKLAECGLDRPAWRITIRKGRGEDVTRTVEVGAAVEGQTNRIYFREAGRPFLYAGKSRLLTAQLEADPAELRDRNLTRLGHWPLGRVRGEWDGTTFVLSREATAWTVIEPEGMTADAIAVEDWFTAVRELEIGTYVDEPDLAKLGLEEPIGRLTCWRPPKEGEDLGEVAVSLHLGRRTDAGVYVRRTDGDDAFLVGHELIDLLTSGAWRFRAKRIFGFRPHDLSPTRMERNGVGGEGGTEHVDGAWTNGAEQTVVSALFDGLFSTAAVRWVGKADGREEEFGLAGDGEGSVTVTFGEGAGAQRFGLIFGRAVEGGRYARAVREDRAGEGVFVVSDATVNRLAAPLVEEREEKK